jgi:hypothetical protein
MMHATKLKAPLTDRVGEKIGDSTCKTFNEAKEHLSAYLQHFIDTLQEIQRNSIRPSHWRIFTFTLKE